MSGWWLVALAWAEPTSLRGATSGQLFRDPLDLVVQPARLTEAAGTDLYLQFAWRQANVGVGGAAVAKVPTGTFAAWASSSFEFDGETDSVRDIEGTGFGDLSAGLAFGGRLGSRLDLGGGLTFDGGFSRRTMTWDPETHEAAVGPTALTEGGLPVHELLGETWTLTPRVGLTAHTGRGRVDVHARLGVQRSLQAGFTREVGEVLEGPLPFTVPAGIGNRVAWMPGLLVDALLPTTASHALRIQADVRGYHATEALARFVSEAPLDPDSRYERAATGAVSGGGASLWLLGHLRLREGVELRTGGVVAVDGQHSLRSVAETTTGPGGEPSTEVDEERGRASFSAAFSVPLALEARVHPRVTLRAFATAGFSATGTENDADPDDLEGYQDRTALTRAWGGGSLGLRWDPLDVLSLELSAGSGWYDANVAVQIDEEGVPAPAPGVADLTNVRTSLVLHL